MDKKLIRNHLFEAFMKGEKHNSATTTEKVQKDEDEINKDYYKEVGKKMDDYDITDDNELEDGVKYNYEGSEKEYHDEMEIRNGQEMLKYDREPSQSFKDRATKSLVGDSTMGNEVKTGEWNPETGEGNGNTESVWGASNDNFGADLVKTVKSSNDKRNKSTAPIKQFGDDIEVLPKGTKTVGAGKKIAVENEINNEPKITEVKMKRLKFKKEFNGVENALNLIPESYKVDSKIFEMTDGNETYRVKWEGNLSEGEAIVISGTNQKLVSEEMNKMKHLIAYNSLNTLGSVKGKERMDENIKFSELIGKTKELLKKE